MRSSGLPPRVGMLASPAAPARQFVVGLLRCVLLRSVEVLA